MISVNTLFLDGKLMTQNDGTNDGINSGNKLPFDNLHVLMENVNTFFLKLLALNMFNWYIKCYRRILKTSQQYVGYSLHRSVCCINSSMIMFSLTSIR